LQFDEIVDYIRRDSHGVALKVHDAFLNAFDLLARHPGLGHTRYDLTRQPLKFWSVHSYLVAYDPATVPLEIVAVCRGLRPPGDWLG
jgi:plasmid stabilization system protein ParE